MSWISRDFAYPHVGSSSSNNNPLTNSISNNDDDDFVDLLIAYWLMEEEEPEGISREPCRTSALTGRRWVEELVEGHHNRLFENCRLDVSTFMRFCQILREGGYIIETPQTRVSIEEAVCMFLVLVSHNTRQRVLAERFQHSTEIINRNVRQVVRGIVLFSKNLIRPRNELTIHPKLLDTQKYYPWFKDCIGAIDGTYVSAWAPANRRDAFRNRHAQISQNVLAVCDHDMRFVYVRAGWEGSANDGRVFLDAVTREDSNFPMPPQGKYYVVDSAYRNIPGFLAPFRGVRYHLQDYRGRGRAPRGWKELYNHRHSSLRNVIERTFGVFKKRFPFLKGPMPNYMIVRQALMVIACATVHNFIREQVPNDEYFLDHEDDDLIVENAENTDSSAQEFDTSPPAVAEWNNFRDELALNLWNQTRINV